MAIRRATRLLALAVSAVPLLATGCRSVAPSLPPLGDVLGAGPPPRVSGAVPAPRTTPVMFESRGGAATPAAAAGQPAQTRSGGTGDVTLNFADTDIREVVRVILGNTLKLNYTIDPSVHGTATLDTGTPLPRAELLPALETLLNQNSATLIRRNGLYAVVPLASAVVSNTVTAGNSAGAGSQVVALRYASAKDLAKLLQAYVPQGSKLAADPGRNALVINGDANAREALLGLIRAFDVNTLAGQSFALFPTENSDAAKTAAALEAALRADKEGPLADLVRVVPLPRANAVLVASSQPRYLDAARRFFSLAQREESATARTWHVYYVQNGQSAELANLLQRAFTPGNVSPIAPPGSTAPGLQTVSMGSGFGGAAGGGATGTSGTGLSGPAASASATPGLASATAARPPAAPAASAPPATEALSSEGGANGETQNRMRIIADPRNNAILIYANGSEYASVAGMLRKVDILPLQVLIDATIAEVTLTGELQYGTQFYFKLDHVAENLGALPGFPPGTLGSTGLVGFAISAAPHFILQSLADVTKVKVLSSPQIYVMDNEPARLQVGQQVPVLTGTATSTLTTGAPIVNSIDYHATGVIMQVTPHINSDGLVTIEVAQEVSDVAPPAANTATGSPTFDDRILQTRVAVHDGQTVALAGLIRDNVQEDNNGVPFLKDVPLLSTFLSSQSNSRTRTELLILLTPHIVHEERDARALTEDLRSRLYNAAITPEELRRKPMEGLANPNGL